MLEYSSRKKWSIQNLSEHITMTSLLSSVYISQGISLTSFFQMDCHTEKYFWKIFKILHGRSSQDWESGHFQLQLFFFNIGQWIIQTHSFNSRCLSSLSPLEQEKQVLKLYYFYKDFVLSVSVLPVSFLVYA